MRYSSLLALGVMLISASSASAADFYLIMQTCKTVASGLSLSDDAVRVFEGTPVRSACTRNGKNVTCQLKFPEGESGPAKADYTVLFDSPPQLHMADAQRSDYVAVHLTNHAAVVITRMVLENVIASKVCQGLYVLKFDRFLTFAKLPSLFHGVFGGVRRTNAPVAVVPPPRQSCV